MNGLSGTDGFVLWTPLERITSDVIAIGLGVSSSSRFVKQSAGHAEIRDKVRTIIAVLKEMVQRPDVTKTLLHNVFPRKGTLPRC